MDDPVALFVPIVLFSSIALVFCVNFYFKHRAKQEFQSTIRAAIDRGQELSPELLDRLGQPGPKSDLRRGIIEVTIGIGIMVCGWLIADDTDSGMTFLAIGLFPIFLGLAHLALWRFSDKT